jgi:hypothetical protein
MNRISINPDCRSVLFFLLLIIAASISGCDQENSSTGILLPSPESTETQTPSATPSLTLSPHPFEESTPRGDKFGLWTEGTQLRGANIWQRIIIPDLDGEEFLGSGYIGPPYNQEDFNNLAEMGANYVNISGPGLFTETPPYQLDLKVQSHLDHLLEMIYKADLFAVITFRTGPGRSDFTFYRDGAGDWFDPSLLREWVWEDPTAQDAWVEMWRYTASRYAGHPVVVGYDLMCEPHPGGIREIYEPEVFFNEYRGTSLDWNQLYPRISKAVREVDSDTPILIGGMGWSSVRWLPYLEPTGDHRTVYLVHQYEPQTQYTHQEDFYPKHSYPDEFDLDWDGESESFNKEWLDGYLQVLDEYADLWDVPLAVNEYGIVRWIPGGVDFLDDQIALFEERGLNHAIWMWDPDWEPWTEEVNQMNYRFGTNPLTDSEVLPNPLIEVLVKYWSKNEIRPSNYVR